MDGLEKYKNDALKVQKILNEELQKNDLPLYESAEKMFSLTKHIFEAYNNKNPKEIEEILEF